MSNNQPPKQQTAYSSLKTNGESFNLEQSYISSEVDNNDTSQSKETTIVVDKNVYEDLVTTCNTMKVQLKTVMEKIEEKKEADDKKNVEISKLKSEYEELKKNNKEVLEELTKEKKGSDPKLELIQKEIKELLKKLEQEEKKNEELVEQNRGEMEKAEVETVGLKSEMDALAEVIENLKKKLSQEEKEKEEWKNKMKQQEECFSIVSRNYSTLELEIQDWRNKLQDEYNKNDELVKKLENEMKEKEMRDSDQIVLQNVVEELMMKVEQEEKHRKELDKKEEEKNASVAELEAERDALEVKIHELTEKLKHLDGFYEEKLKKYGNAVKLAEVESVKMKSERELLQDNIQEWTTKLEQEEKKTKRLEIDVEDKQQRVNELEGEQKSLEQNIKEFSKKLSGQNEEISHLKVKLQDEGQKNTFKIAELTSNCDSLTVKLNAIEQSSKLKCDEIKTLQRKYSNLKKRGIQMLAEKSEDNQKLQLEMAEQQKKVDELNEQLESLRNSVKLEKEKRKRYENEVKAAERIVKDALREEKISRKMTEKKCLAEKTEKMALQEKVMDMTNRGVVVRKSCPISEHNLLVQRIDVLQRQRDILVESINNRETPI
ncbi:hypothetical protein GCK72_005185 [Caenorhabditis remanei]|uniref:Uncharacterized protein n=1 Tax=Caenorhabditis remanei TaxID=31234 RepID=A0A6A5HFU3_CAERE|nr:hypothetical protein GCK72_005185 [Caenorhabditis remanei]KAF1765233.1 hypothetical protein GCK72_005185 [Caenorhabditis remanei]